MDNFLPYRDELSTLIQEKAAFLYKTLQAIPAGELGMPHYCLVYYKGSHVKRLFFSIETSAHLLYKSIRLAGKPVHETVVMDYGAGIGTLYLLAKLIGCKKVVYNDHLEDWKYSASLIANAAGITIDSYIVGDIDSTLQQLAASRTACDIIISRNVIEHIYKLEVFYKAIAQYQPTAIVYSSTTANIYNPATHLQHRLIHRRMEKRFYPVRQQLIRQANPTLTAAAVDRLAKKTRGLGGEDFQQVITGKSTPEMFAHWRKRYSNTCDPSNGVWAEHLLTFKQYRALAGNSYTLSFFPGFWDTHYKNAVANICARLLNSMIPLNRSLGILLAPFIYVVAKPVSRKP